MPVGRISLFADQVAQSFQSFPEVTGFGGGVIPQQTQCGTVRTGFAGTDCRPVIPNPFQRLGQLLPAGCGGVLRHALQAGLAPLQSLGDGVQNLQLGLLTSLDPGFFQLTAAQFAGLMGRFGARRTLSPFQKS